MKTPEEMAEEYANDWHKDCDYPAEILRHTKKATETVFLAGYQAAKKQPQPQPFHAGADVYIIDANNPLPKPMPLSIAEQVQFADADKVMCNTTMEEIKAVDTGELMPITNLPTPAKWISVKERLPEYDQLALLWQSELQVQFVGRRVDSGLAFPLYYWECTSDFFEAWKEIYFPKLMQEGAVSHWMPLPAPPRDK